MTDFSITIGGTEYPVPVMNFRVLEEVWPAIRAYGEAPDVVGQASLAIKIYAAALTLGPHTQLTENGIKNLLVGREFVGLVAGLPHYLKTSGLTETDPGEVAPQPPTKTASAT